MLPISRASLGRPRGRTASATAAVVVLFALLTAVPAAGDTKSELAAAKKRLEQIGNEIDAAEARRDRLQAEADAIAAQVAATEHAIEETEARIEETQVGINRRENKIEVLKTRLGMRARDAYIKGPGGIFEVILGSSSFGDLSDRLALYDSVQQADADLAASIETVKITLEGRKANLDEMVETLEIQQAAQLAALDAQSAKLSEMAQLQTRLQAKFAEARGLLKTLEKRFAAEKAAIARARELAEGGAPIVGNGVFKYCPVDSPNSFSNDFGAPRSGGRTHQGNDIFAPYGTPIRATFDGVVTNASNSLGGLSVYVHGGGGYTYNAHLSRFGTMGSVSAGTIIGYVGNTGNARYTPPHNHFEWHPGGGSAVNPYYYLLEACR